MVVMTWGLLLALWVEPRDAAQHPTVPRTPPVSIKLRLLQHILRGPGPSRLTFHWCLMAWQV